MLLSEASRIYDRSKKISPLTKQERKKMYAARSVKVQRKIPMKKFSPFNTISREARDSYLLRVTKQPNTQTNYHANHSAILTSSPRPTIDKAAFERIIGDVKAEDFSKQLSPEADPRCVRSQTLSPENKRPLTVRDHQKWRKTNEHFDFEKQESTKRVKLFPKLSAQMSTNQSFMRNLRETIESNFNNYQRFSLKSDRNKAHSFNSDFGHEYLKEILNRQKQPQYNVQACKESFTRKALGEPKGELRFNLYREKIRTRLDRNDPEWYTILEYDPQKKQSLRGQLFEQQLNRLPNDIHSKYPIRLSLETIVKAQRN